MRLLCRFLMVVTLYATVLVVVSRAPEAFATCTIGSPNLYFGLQIKTNSVRGGYAENIYLNDIQISNLTKEVVSCDFYRSEGDTGPLTPRVRNVELRNVTVDHVRDGFYMRGYPRSPIQDMRLINCTFASIDRPSTIENVDRPSRTSTSTAS